MLGITEVGMNKKCGKQKPIQIISNRTVISDTFRVCFKYGAQFSALHFSEYNLTEGKHK